MPGQTTLDAFHFYLSVISWLLETSPINRPKVLSLKGGMIIKLGRLRNSR